MRPEACAALNGVAARDGSRNGDDSGGRSRSLGSAILSELLGATLPAAGALVFRVSFLTGRIFTDGGRDFNRLLYVYINCQLSNRM
jgi:hypothetical protein